MSNGIYLTLEQYKDKDLPITIMINGNTYHSQFALATTQTTWFEMGKQHGMELGGDNTYSDKEMSRMHDAWYDEGYKAGKRDQFNDDYKLIEKANERNFKLIDEVHEKSRKLGYDEGYEAGKKAATSDIEMQWMHDQWYNEGFEAGIDRGIEQTLQDDRVKEELERTKQIWYATGKEEGYGDGYEDGKKANGYSEDDIKQLHTDNEFTRKVWYDKGKAEGYGEGYNDGYAQCKHDHQIEDDSCKDCKEEPSRDEDEPIGPEQTEYAKGYEEGKAAGYEEGYERGFMDLRLILKK